MSGPEEPALGVESVTPPASPPPTKPDDRTREERESAHASALSKSPAYRATFIAERETARLSRELESTRAERVTVQKTLDRIAPELAATRQAFHDAKMSSGSPRSR